MIMEEQRTYDVSRDDAREYILDILQELAQLARKSGDSTAEASVTQCWQAIWRAQVT